MPELVRVMLDTNIASLIIRGTSKAVQSKLQARPPSDFCISSITEGELRFGIARRPEATRLHESVMVFLRHIEVLPWDSAAATAYGVLRSELEGLGTPLGNLDTLIAAHAVSTECILATNDMAFRRVSQLQVVRWARGS